MHGNGDHSQAEGDAELRACDEDVRDQGVEPNEVQQRAELEEGDVPLAAGGDPTHDAHHHEAAEYEHWSEDASSSEAPTGLDQ